MKNYTIQYHTFIITLLFLLTACSSKNKKSANDLLSDKSDTMALAPVSLHAVVVANMLTSPVGMAVANDGSNRLFILEQPGRIRIIKNGKLLDQPFLNITANVDDLNLGYSEKGLLGLAFHPHYKDNGMFYIYYSAPSTNNGSEHKSIVAAYKVSNSNSDVADTAATVVLSIEEPESNHNGGQLAFGPDGFLYIGVGDGGGAGDEHGSIGNGQDLNTLLGKILRINVDNLPYTIPADNPFNGTNERKEIYAYGLRNPWRFSFDRKTGQLFCGDVGQNKFEEVDIIEKGKNYGWRIMEGMHCYNSENCNHNNLTYPIYEYKHSVGISITGGYVYQGKAIAELEDTYVFADWTGKLFGLKQTDKWQAFNINVNGTSNDLNCKINALGEDENGELYLLTQKLTGPKDKTGMIYKIVK